MTNTKVVFVLLLSLFYIGCAHQQKVKPISKCLEEKESAKVETKVQRNAPQTYQIELIFSVLMNGHYSFLPPRGAKVIKTFWKGNHFNIVVEAKREVNSLSFVVNPKGFDGGFMTKCGTTLPTQKISAKVKEMEK